MTDEVIFYTNPMSRGRIVRWMLEEVGAPYDARVLAYGPAMKSPEYRAVNPMGKVPAIVHRGVVVTETAAICAYLADAFPDAGLAPPANDPLRGPYYRWLFFAAGPLEAATMDRMLGITVPEDRRAMIGYGSMDDVLATLETAVAAGPYLVGDRFSTADLYVGAHIGWGLQMGSLEKRPAFETYWARLADRPAWTRACGIDDALEAEETAG
jgi:glutathione S-transferase